MEEKKTIITEILIGTTFHLFFIFYSFSCTADILSFFYPYHFYFIILRYVVWFWPGECDGSESGHPGNVLPVSVKKIDDTFCWCPFSDPYTPPHMVNRNDKDRKKRVINSFVLVRILFEKKYSNFFCKKNTQIRIVHRDVSKCTS